MSNRSLVSSFVLFFLSACGGAPLHNGERFDLPTATSLGGAVLSAPRVQPIYFAGFPHAAEMETFMARLPTSGYWPAVTAEYGVGKLTALPGFSPTVTVPAAVTAADLQNLLGQVLTEGAATLGQARTDTIYALFFDPATAINVENMTLCGQGHPSGFHDELSIGDIKVPVAVIPTCATSDSDSRLTGADILMPSISHELVEAATDPYVRSAPAFLAIDDAHALWAAALGGAEVGDLCENELPALIVPDDIGFPVQRIWSNAAARAGTGPCVPVPPGEVYFNGQANLPDQVTLKSLGGTITVPALTAAVGQTASAQVSLHSVRAATTPVAVVAIEVDDPGGQISDHPQPVKANLGQTITVPITSSTDAKSGVVPLLIVASDGSAYHLWVGAINRR
ncbi:MAG: hypothetical protein QOI66_3693 [Myxococcales bacterium]|nr:hypothetical protein [Myxococcales bacterium]